MNGDEPRVVTVSREALRADLAEMELRLRIWIASELHGKADRVEFDRLKHLVVEKVAWADSLMPLRHTMIGEHKDLLVWKRQSEAGTFTPAQKAELKVSVSQAFEEKNLKSWTVRQRGAAILVALLTIGLTVLNLILDHYPGV
jgi:hypothetical protein